MKIRIFETVRLDAFPHGLRGVLPRACLPAGEAVETPPTAAECLQSGAFYSAAAFVNEWIGPAPRVVVPRDFTFKAVIGEPSW